MNLPAQAPNNTCLGVCCSSRHTLTADTQGEQLGSSFGAVCNRAELHIQLSWSRVIYLVVTRRLLTLKVSSRVLRPAPSVTEQSYISSRHGAELSFQRHRSVIEQSYLSSRPQQTAETPVAKFLVPDWGDTTSIIEYDIRLSYRSASLCSLAGRYDNPMLSSNISQSGTTNLAKGEQWGSSSVAICNRAE